MLRLISAIAAALALLAGGPAMAQGYPSHPVTLVVPSAPGGTSDLTGRLVAQYLTQALNQSFIVENRPGAGNTIGASYVAHAAADGYTLLLTDTSHAISQSLYRHLPYDAATAFSHIALIARTPYILVANPRLGVKDMKGLIALAKAHPGKLTYASGGIGTGPHLAGALFAMQAKINMTHIPYKGAGPALNDVLSGQVDTMFVAAPTAVPLIKAGRLVALASSDASARAPGLPDVPTVAQAGLPNYSVSAWFGLSAPRGVPKNIIQTLNREVDKMLAVPAVRAKLASLGMQDTPLSAQGYTNLFDKDMKRWATVVHAANVHVD